MGKWGPVGWLVLVGLGFSGGRLEAAIAPTPVVAWSVAGLPQGVTAWPNPPLMEPCRELDEQRHYRSMRISSSDPNHRNDDYVVLPPGQIYRLPEIEGPATIRHFWCTIESPDNFALRKLVLRMFWDGAAQPSVECPLGDFFGVGSLNYEPTLLSAPLLCVPNGGMNCYFPMSFARKARIEVENQDWEQKHDFFYQVDYERYDQLPPDRLYFHAAWQWAQPVQSGAYEILNTSGEGHWAGLTMTVRSMDPRWWGEGDDLVYIDGSEKAELHGTGSEDFIGGAWMFTRPFMAPNIGCFSCDLRIPEAQLFCMYRFFLESPVVFHRSLRVLLENYHDNDLSSTAYWYQTTPEGGRYPLPPAPIRLPRGTAYVLPRTWEAEQLLAAAKVDQARYTIIPASLTEPPLHRGQAALVRWFPHSADITVTVTAEQPARGIRLQLLYDPLGATIQCRVDGKAVGPPISTNDPPVVADIPREMDIPEKARVPRPSLMLPVDLEVPLAPGRHQLRLHRVHTALPAVQLRWDYVQLRSSD